MNNREIQLFADAEHKAAFSSGVVGQLTGVAGDVLTAWRRREIIWTVDGGRRVEFTAFGLARVVIVNELAWVIGPSRAAKIADDLINWTAGAFELLRSGGNSADQDWTHTFLIIKRPDGSHETAQPTEGGDDVAGALSWHLIRGEPSAFGYERAILVVPIGRILASLAVRGGATLAVREA